MGPLDYNIAIPKTIVVFVEKSCSGLDACPVKIDVTNVQL